MDKILDFLNEYLPVVNYHVPTKIDRGGCGIFAMLLSKALTELGIPHQIRALYMYREDGMYQLRRFIDTNDHKWLYEAGADHVAIYLDGKYVDSDGVTNSYEDLPTDIIIEPEQLELLVKYSTHWSHIFDRSQVPLLERYLKDIPMLYNGWSKGTYKKVDVDHKKLNSYTQAELNDNGDLYFRV